MKQSVFLRATVKSEYDCVALKNTAGVYLACSEPYARFLGKSSVSDVVGQTDKALIPKQTSTEQLTLDVKSLTSGVYSLAAQTDLNAGQSRTAKSAIARSPIRDSSGKTLGVGIRVITPSNSDTNDSQGSNTFDKVLQEGQYGFIVFSAKGILFVDNNAASTLGHERNDSQTSVTPLQDIISLSQLKQIEQALSQQPVTKHNGKRLSVTLNRSDHQPLRVAINGVRVNWGYTDAYLLAFVGLEQLSTATKTAVNEGVDVEPHGLITSQPPQVTANNPVLSSHVDLEKAPGPYFPEPSNTFSEQPIEDGYTTRHESGSLHGIRRELGYLWTGMQGVMVKALSLLGFLLSVFVIIVLLCNFVLLVLIALRAPSAINRWTVVWHENLIASPLLAVLCVVAGVLFLLRSRGKRKHLLRQY